MQLFLNDLVSSLVQIILFALIPFIWWLIGYRKKESFFSWIGLKKAKNLRKRKLVLSMLLTEVGFLLLGLATLYFVRDAETAFSQYTGLGLAGLPAVIVYALLKTSLSEEILFRGFLLKRFQNKLGFVAGNLLQSALFGLLHGAMFFSMVGIFKAALIVLLTGAVAYAMGYINEKQAGGSILPSWCVHFISNLVSGCIALFSVA